MNKQEKILRQIVQIEEKQKKNKQRAKIMTITTPIAVLIGIICWKIASNSGNDEHWGYYVATLLIFPIIWIWLGLLINATINTLKKNIKQAQNHSNEQKEKYKKENELAIEKYRKENELAVEKYNAFCNKLDEKYNAFCKKLAKTLNVFYKKLAEILKPFYKKITEILKPFYKKLAEKYNAFIDDPVKYFKKMWLKILSLYKKIKAFCQKCDGWVGILIIYLLLILFMYIMYSIIGNWIY